MTRLLTAHLGPPSLLTARAPGATWTQRAFTTPLGARVPRPTGAALLAAWDDDDPPDLPGWTVRLEPLRAVGAWPPLGELAFGSPAADDEPVAVLTLGHPRIGRFRQFVRASAPAEREARDHPALLYGTAMALPPRFVATFSLWRDVAAMRAYVGGAHGAAMKANAADPFHHEQLFARFRPSAYAGLP